jgi:hypothetical protein
VVAVHHYSRQQDFRVARVVAVLAALAQMVQMVAQIRAVAAADQFQRVQFRVARVVQEL